MCFINEDLLYIFFDVYRFEEIFELLELGWVGLQSIWSNHDTQMYLMFRNTSALGGTYVGSLDNSGLFVGITETDKYCFVCVWLVDFLNLSVFSVVILGRIFTEIVANQLELLMKTEGVDFIDFQPLAYSLSQTRNLNAFNAVLTWLKTFKYFSISPRMSLFTRVRPQHKHTLTHTKWRVSVCCRF